MPRAAGAGAGRSATAKRSPARCACAAPTRCTAATGAHDEAIAGLHFETCYYQGIDYCLREGLQPLRTRRAGRAQGRARLPAGAHAQPPLHRRPGLRRRRCTAGAPSEREGALRYRERGAGAQPLSGARTQHPEMAIPLLGAHPASPFPPARRALREPDGLLAVGGDLSPARLLNAYRQRHLPLVLGRPADPVVVPGPAHGLRHRRLPPVLALPARLRRSPWVLRADTPSTR